MRMWGTVNYLRFHPDEEIAAEPFEPAQGDCMAECLLLTSAWPQVMNMEKTLG